MMDGKCLRWLVIFIPISTLLLLSCNLHIRVPDEINVTKTPTYIMFNTDIPVSSVEAISPTQVASIPLVDYTVTPLPKTDPSPTPSPIPTLIPQVAIETVNSLLENNGGCELPCWWGITPGKTTLSDAHRKLAAFTDMKIVRSPRADDNKIFREYRYKISPEKEGSLVLVTLDDVVIEIGPGPNSTEGRYTVHDLLKYGEPRQIYITTFYSVPFSPVPFTLVLDLQDRNILAFYLLDARYQNEYVKACPENSGPFLILTAPGYDWTFDEIEKWILGEKPPADDPHYLRSIDKATDFSVPSFFSTFLDKQDACILTKRNLWLTP